MTAETDRLLAEAWATFCDRLKAAGEIPFRKGCPPHDAERTAGFEMLARNISLALLFSYDNADPSTPELLHVFDPLRKQGGDNGDGNYVFARINGVDTYRITGQIGSARFFAVTVKEDGPTPWGGSKATTMFRDQLEMASDGSMELFISPEPHPGNWIRSTPQTYRVMIRQFFADWENEVPMRLRIDRLGDSPPAPQLSPVRLASGLLKSADWLRDSITYFAELIEKWQAHPNGFVTYKRNDPNLSNTPGGEALVAYWVLQRDEALVIRVQPPKAEYWSVEFGNYWWETMDYRYRLASTNCHYAQLERDGELIVVISGEDPGVPNWLDTSGYAEGYVCYRWMRADAQPVPDCTLVKRSELFAHLPRDVCRITPERRRAQLLARRRGVINRFGH
jgi:hypothetical protein